MDAAEILAGNRRSLARAATLVENRKAEDLLIQLFPHSGRALIAGITGPGGVGKSTLVDLLIRTLRAEGKTVAVVAIDPSSPFSGGAVLGDRVRMMQHHADPGVYIRSMASRGALGGLAAAASDMTILLDAAGFDVILVETVGVGQGEVEIIQVATVTAVVLAPGMGDEVQAMKAGIMEIADLFVINKADREGANQLEQDIRQTGFDGPVVRTVASAGEGGDQVIAALRSIPDERRTVRWRARLREMLRERLLERLSLEELDRAADDVAERRRDPYSVIHEFCDRHIGSRTAD